jgi:predicted RND superfamily exporter protein
MVSALIAIAATVASVCISIGLGHVADRIERDKATTNEMNASQLIKRLYSAMDQIKSKSRQAYYSMLDKLEQIPHIDTVGSLKQYLVQEKRNLSDKASKTRELASAVEERAMGYQNELMNLANQPETWKNSKAGKEALNSLVQRKDDLVKTVENTLEGEK